MELRLEQSIAQKIMISFEGAEPPAGVLALMRSRPPAGVTLFRRLNVRSPAQVRALTAALQEAARAEDRSPLLIAADQEGGQLMAIGEGTTPFPGNLALGAAGSPDLACQVGRALGLELAAMGVNVDFAPVCDVNLNPLNPVVGARSFGEDPARVAELAAGMVRGLQEAGVAAAAKHFPGHGDTDTDSHFGTPVVPYDETRLRQVELLPFRAAVEAGVRLVMTAHLALPALNSGSFLPATLSPALLRGLLRGEMGFEGLIASDALDMKAIHQGNGLAIDAIAAVAAGIDLLLLSHTHSLQDLENVTAGLTQAAERGLLSVEEIRASARRVLELKRWLAHREQPGLEVVGCAAHRALALEVARRAVTLVRDEPGLLPLRLPAGARLGVIIPEPQDLTPADTSSYVRLSIAAALRRFHPQVEEFVVQVNPPEKQVQEAYNFAAGCDLVIAGTINAREHPGQAALVNALLQQGPPTIPVALRMPYDLEAYPAAPVYLCTYSILPPAIEALAEALFGEIPLRGRLPVSVRAG